MSKTGKIALTVLALVVAVIVAIVVVNTSKARQRERDYAEAKALYDEEQYEQASEIYAKLRDDAWLTRCSIGIAERDAQALFDAGQPDEALALLRQDAPESELRTSLAEEYAATLIGTGDYEAALAILQVDAPESENILNCERIITQIAEEETFKKSALASAWDDANASLEKIKALNAETKRLTDKELEAMRSIAEGNYSGWHVASSWGLLDSSDNAGLRRVTAELFAANGYYSDAFKVYQALGDENGMRAMLAAMVDADEHGMSTFEAYRTLDDENGMRSEAAWLLDKGKYTDAYKAYETLGDEDGKRAVIEVQATDGQLAQALHTLISLEDYEQANALLDRIPTEASLVSDKGLALDDDLSTLIRKEDDAALALASRIVDKAVEECRALIAKGIHSAPWYALNALRDSVPALWREEWQALMLECIETPESHIVKDTGLLAKSGGTIMVYTGKSGRCLTLREMERTDAISEDSLPTGQFISVYIKPNSHYTFTIKSGYYKGSVGTGENWFGDLDGFGPMASFADVQISYDPYNPGVGRYLDGSYSITFE